VAGVGVAVAARANQALPDRLRAETARCHEQVESVMDIPGRVRTGADDIGLLDGLSGLHTGLERHLSGQAWDRAWAGVGVTIAAHCGADLLVADLAELGVAPTTATMQPRFPCFGHALGCLYELEGFALGGRVVAGMVRSAIGAGRTAFLTGHGRRHQWPAVRNSLQRFDTQDGDGDPVVASACSTFAVFAHQLAHAGDQVPR
jgi:heme oxygenase